MSQKKKLSFATSGTGHTRIPPTEPRDLLQLFRGSCSEDGFCIYDADLRRLKLTSDHYKDIVNNVLQCTDIALNNRDIIVLFGNLYDHFSKVQELQMWLLNQQNVIDLCDNISQIIKKIRLALNPNDNIFAIVLEKAIGALGLLGRKEDLGTLEHLCTRHFTDLNSYVYQNLLGPVAMLEENLLKQIRHSIHESPNIENLTELITICPNINVELLTNAEDIQSVIHVICMVGEDDLALILTFLKNIPHFNLKEFINLQRCVDGNTALHLASKNGKKNILQCLIEHGASALLKNTLEQTAADVAANIDIVNIIKKSHTFDLAKHTHLFTAMLKKSKLLEETLPVNDVDLLDYAIDCSNVAIVREVLHRDQTCVFKKNKFGTSPLVKAIGLENVDIVRLLLQNGADVSAVYGGINVLHMAAKKGNVQLVEQLLDFIDDVNVPTNYNDLTALHLASENGNVAIVKLLLAHGANFESKNGLKQTPFDVSINKAVSDVLNAISDLHRVIRENHVSGVESLTDIFMIAKRSDNFDMLWKATNDHGKTAIQLIMEKKGATMHRQNNGFSSEMDAIESAMRHFSFIINDILPHSKDIPLKEHDKVILFGRLYKYFLRVKAFNWNQHNIEDAEDSIRLFQILTKIIADLRSALAPNDTLFAIVLERTMEVVGYSGAKKNFDLLFHWHRKPESNVYSCIETNFVKPVTVLEETLLQEVRHFIHETPCIDTLKELITICPIIDVEMLTNENQQSVIHVISAFDEDDLELISVFLQRVSLGNLKEFVNLQRSADGNTALHSASKNGKIKIVKCLLEHGADTSLMNFLGETALDVAANDTIANLIRKADLFDSSTHANAHLITTLLKSNFEEEKIPTDDIKLLDYGIDCGNIAIVEDVLKRDISSANAVNESGEPFLVKAISLENVDIVRTLLQHSANPLALYRGMNALHFAAKKGDVRVVDVLLDHMDNVNARDHLTFNTALHMASENGHVAIVKLLLAHGANFESKNYLKQTPLEVSISVTVSNVFNAVADLHRIVQEEDVGGENCLIDIFLKAKRSDDYNVFLKAKNDDGKTAIELMMNSKGPVYLMFKKFFLCSSEPPAGS